MTARHQFSRTALELIMRFEGFRPRAARLADGRWTIGYGHTQTAREGAAVSQDDAEALLLYDLRPIAALVNELAYTPLTQNQFDALVAFAYGIGLDNFRRSAVLRHVNEGNLIQAACAIEMWRKADFEGERIVVDALVRRRAAEKTLFLTPEDGWIPAPSPILRARVDYDVGYALPKASTELESAMSGDVAEAHRPQAAPPETAPASLAAAEAVKARLNEILPETAQAPVTAGSMVAPAIPQQMIAEPVISAPLPVESAPVEAQPVVGPDEPPRTAALAEAVASPSYLAAPALFGAIFGTQAATPAPAATLELTVDPTPESAPPQPLTEPSLSHDKHFDIPERDPEDLSRRVVWREAPMETEASRLLGDGLSGVSPLWLMALFLAGLAVFAGGIVWGMSTKGTGVASWILGLIGILCVVSAVYVYLERLGERED
jgi:lysozyme